MKIILLYIALFFLASCAEEKTFDATGRFEADDVMVSAETGGKLLRFDVSEGMSINAGDDVALTDTVQLALERRQLEAQIDAQLASRPDIRREAASLRTQIAKQKKERKRFEQLVNDGASASKQLDDIVAEIHVLEGNLDALLSRLGSSTASINNSAAALRVRIDQIEEKIARCHVKAPITGTVLAKYVEKGELLQPGRPMFKIANLNEMYLRSYFTSAQLADIKLGDEVRVVADFGSDKQHEYKGKITWISSESEFTPKTIQTKDTRADMVYAVKIAVKNDGRLKIGFAGEVYLK